MVWNPGRLPYGLTTTRLRELHSSDPTNPTLAYPMFLAGAIEHVGTGTTDIIASCEEKGLRSPEFIQTEDFRTIIYRPIPNEASFDKVNDKVNDKEESFQLTDIQKSVIWFIKRQDKRNDKVNDKVKDKVNTRYIAQHIGVSYPTVQRAVKVLESYNLIRRVGSDKEGYWTAISAKQ